MANARRRRLDGKASAFRRADDVYRHLRYACETLCRKYYCAGGLQLIPSRRRRNSRCPAATMERSGLTVHRIFCSSCSWSCLLAFFLLSSLCAVVSWRSARDNWKSLVLILNDENLKVEDADKHTDLRGNESQNRCWRGWYSCLWMFEMIIEEWKLFLRFSCIRMLA